MQYYVQTRDGKNALKNASFFRVRNINMYIYIFIHIYMYIYIYIYIYSYELFIQEGQLFWYEKFDLDFY